MTERNVFQLCQPGAFTDPLTEVLRNGARALLSHAVDAEVAALLDCQFEIRKAHLPRRRPRHNSTQQAVKPPAEGQPSATHPATDDIGRLFGVAVNHLSNERHRAPGRQPKLAAEKLLKRRFSHTIIRRRNQLAVNTLGRSFRHR
jgi:hypothetical protein